MRVDYVIAPVWVLQPQLEPILTSENRLGSSPLARTSASGAAVAVYDRSLGRVVTYDTSGAHRSTLLLPFPITADHPTLVITNDSRIYVGAVAADSSYAGQIQELDRDMRGPAFGQ